MLGCRVKRFVDLLSPRKLFRMFQGGQLVADEILVNLGQRRVEAIQGSDGRRDLGPTERPARLEPVQARDEPVTARALEGQRDWVQETHGGDRLGERLEVAERPAAGRDEDMGERDRTSRWTTGGGTHQRIPFPPNLLVQE
jgi:hypothetical protein